VTVAASCTKDSSSAAPSSVTPTTAAPNTTPSSTATPNSATGSAPPPTSSPTSRPTTPPGPPTVCTTSELSVIPGAFKSGTTTDSGTFVFTNIADGPCVMNGYPGLTMSDESNTSLETHVVHGSNTVVPAVPVTRFLLKRNESASFYYGYSSVPNSKTQKCPSSASVAIAPPPGGGKSVSIKFGIAPCGGNITVSAVKSGAILS
jgi:Protein of unknown function (DUF4232)